jgi:hypothetical protein
MYHTVSLIRIFLSQVPDSGSKVKKAPDPGSGCATKNFSIFTQLIVTKLLEIDPECLVQIPDLNFFPSRIRIRNTAFYLKSYKLSLNLQFDSYISIIPIVLEFILSFLHDLKEPNN